MPFYFPRFGFPKFKQFSVYRLLLEQLCDSVPLDSIFPFLVSHIFMIKWMKGWCLWWELMMKPHVDWKKISCHPFCIASTFLWQMLAQKGKVEFIHTFPGNGDLLVTCTRMLSTCTKNTPLYSLSEINNTVRGVFWGFFFWYTALL